MTGNRSARRIKMQPVGQCFAIALQQLQIERITFRVNKRIRRQLKAEILPFHSAVIIKRMRHFRCGIDLQSEIRKSACPGMICSGQTQMKQTAVRRRMTPNRAGLRIELQPLRQCNAI